MVSSLSSASALSLLKNLLPTKQVAPLPVLPSANPVENATSAIKSIVASAAKVVAPPSYIDRVKLSGQNAIDSILAGGDHWFHDAGGNGSSPSAVARHSLTYSFMSAPSTAGDAQGFAEFSEGQKDTVRNALAYISSLADVSFQEVSAGGGDLQYGSNVQSNSAGYARYPGDPNGGQVMLANNQSSFTADGGNWSIGSYEWETLLHETGHALGLKHSGNYNAGGGGTPGPYLPGAQDNRNNTIMSYNNAANMYQITYSAGSFTRNVINPISYQANDIAALQYLYGASQTAAGGQGVTYSWATDQAFSQTIWDPNAASTIDLGNQTKKNIVDLRAGHQSSIGLRDAYSETPFTAKEFAAMTTYVNNRKVKLSAVLGASTYTGTNNLMIAKGSHVDNAIGGSGSDTFITNGERDTISSGDGDDQIFVSAGTAAALDGTSLDGGAGKDTVFLKKVGGYTWAMSDDKSQVLLLQSATRTQAAHQVAAINVAGVETIRYWNGTTAAGTGDKALYNAPAASLFARANASADEPRSLMVAMV